MLVQFTNVLLAQPYQFGGAALPKGASGTIVSVFPDTRSYTVEFFEPRHCIMSVPHDRLKPDIERA